MNPFRTLAMAIGIGAAAFLLTPETAEAQWGYGRYYGSPYTGYYSSYYPGTLGYRNIRYSVVNPNGTQFSYSFGYPGYYGYGYPGLGYGYGYAVVPTPQFGFGSYSYVPSAYVRPGYIAYFNN